MIITPFIIMNMDFNFDNNEYEFFPKIIHKMQRNNVNELMN